MFSHVMIGANDVEKSKAFYDAVLGTLGHKPGIIDPKGRCMYLAGDNIFMLTLPIDGNAATHANGGTIGFAAANPEAADAFYEAGLANGGTICEDAPPGIREGNGMRLYLTYLRDPAGNKVCAMHRL